MNMSARGRPAYDWDTHQRYVQVREQRTKKDYAELMDWLLKTHYPAINKIDLVQDNGSGHPAQHPSGGQLL